MSTFSNQENSKNITRATIIKDVAEMMNCYEEDIRQVYDCIEASIESHLMEVTEEQNIKVQAMNGVFLEGKFIPEHGKRHVTGDDIIVPDTIFVRMRLTRKFRDKIINRFRKELEIREILKNEEEKI